MAGAVAEKFGEPPGAKAAARLHLPQPVLGVNEAEREIGILGRGCDDMRDAPGIAQNVHLRGETGEGDLSVGSRQRAAQREIANPGSCACNEQDQDDDAAKPEGNRDFAAPHGVMI